MRTPDYLHALAGLDVLAGCSRTELERVASLLTPLTIPAGATLLREHTSGREFLIVADGTLAVTTGSGDETTLLGTVGAGQVVGEMALLNRAPRTATVTTATPSTVYAGSSGEFFAFLRAAPTAAERIIATAKEREEAKRK